MLEKLLTNLKKSLPEPLRKKMGLENISEDDSEDIESSTKNSEENEGESSDSAPPEDKRKKQISMIIRVVVVLGLGYLAVDNFLLKEDPQSEIANIPVKPRKPRKKPLPVATTTTTATSTTTTAVTPAMEGPVSPLTADTAIPTPAMSETKPLETATVEKDQAPVIETPAVAAEMPKETVSETKAPVEEINIAEKKIEDEKPLTEPVISESQVDKTIDSLIDDVDGKEAIKKETRLEDKIVADDTYTPPPAYDQLGRGLVYNCKEKYWSCLDKMAYVSCNKNMKWNKSHGKVAECVVQNVYNSDDDCAVVQKYNVSTSKATLFCQ